jgi:putative FmdB family regulatory protein
MPTYESQCLACKHEYDYIATVKRCLEVPVCPVCGGDGVKVIRKAPRGFVTGKFEPFVSTVDGTLIANQRQLREHNTRNGVVNLNDGYSEEKILAGDLAPPKANKQQEMADLQKDIGESIQMVNAGYRPEIRCDDGH